MNRKNLGAIGFAIVLSVLFGTAINVGSQNKNVLAATAVDAKIQIVWPHDDRGNPATVESAQKVNVEAYLFHGGSFDPVACDFPNKVTIRWARNSSSGDLAALIPSHENAVGQREIKSEEARTFPVWVFNDVVVHPGTEFPVNPFTGEPITNRTYFFLEVEGTEARTNV